MAAYCLQNEVAVAAHKTYVLHLNASVWVTFHAALCCTVFFRFVIVWGTMVFHVSGLCVMRCWHLWLADIPYYPTGVTLCECTSEISSESHTVYK
jgi:hypothetical protein